MGKKVYIGNIGPNADQASLMALFSLFGTVERAYIVTDRQTGISKGFGFVTMDNDEEAKQAISELNETKLESRDIVVNEAKPRKSNY